VAFRPSPGLMVGAFYPSIHNPVQQYLGGFDLLLQPLFHAPESVLLGKLQVFHPKLLGCLRRLPGDRLQNVLAAHQDQAGERINGHIRYDVGGVYYLALAGYQPFMDALPNYVLEDQPELVLAQSGSPEVGNGGVIRHFFIHSQPKEELVGQIDSGVFHHLAVGVSIEVLKKAQTEHELGVFRRPAEVRSVSVLHQLVYERKINHLVDLPEQMVLRDDAVVEVTSIE